MKEQEQYKKMLKKMIDATENNKIKTTEEMIQTLIFELTHHRLNNQKQEARP